MSQIELTADTDAEGNAHVDIPTGEPNARVKLRVMTETLGRRRAKTKEEYLAFIDSVFGKCDDPTFVPPDDQSLEAIEPL